MRLVVCYISVWVTATLLAGCGQSGALQLPSDPNYDKRARYLLYPHHSPSAQENATVQQEQPVSEQFSSPSTPSNQPAS